MVDLTSPEARERIRRVIRKKRESSLCGACDRILRLGGRCNCKEMADAALAEAAAMLKEE